MTCSFLHFWLASNTFRIDFIHIVNVEDVPPGVHSTATDAAQKETEIVVTWDTEALDLVSQVDVVVYEYKEDDHEIVFSPVMTLGESIDYNLGRSSFSDIPFAELDSDVGVIAVMDSESYEPG